MSLLWTKASRHASVDADAAVEHLRQKWVGQPADVDDDHVRHWVDEEEHDEHWLHPTFAAAGIKDSPCGYSRCTTQDEEHSDAFDDAERHMFHHGYDSVPVHHLDLKKTTLHGFEPTCDMHTLRKYIKDPTARQGLPMVFKHKGEHHIMNGHHGLAAALIRGDSHADVHLIDLDKD